MVAVPVLIAAAAVATVLFGELVLDVVKLRRVKRDAAPLGTLPVRGARLATSPTVETPTAVGYLHPAVIVPRGFRARVDEREWDAVVAHECAHLARCDDWAKAAQSAIVRLGWWLPGLWLLGRALDLERELASDERAAVTTGARGYAACLLRLATERTPFIAPAFGGRRTHVAIRVERLLRPAPASRAVVRASALGAFTALAVGTLGVALVVLPGTGPGAARPAPRALLAVRAHPAPRIAQRAHSSSRPRRPHREVAHLARPAMVRPLAAPAAAPVAPRLATNARAPWRSHHDAAASPLRTAGVEIAFGGGMRVRCRTCAAPLVTPDGALPQAPSAAPPGGGPPPVAVSANGPDDAAAGPVGLEAQDTWLRLPIRVIWAP